MDSLVLSAKKPLNKGGTRKALSLRRTTGTFRSWFGCLCTGHCWAQLQQMPRLVKILLFLHFIPKGSCVHCTGRRSGACDSFVLWLKDVFGLSSPHLCTPGTCRSEGSKDFSGHLTAVWMLGVNMQRLMVWFSWSGTVVFPKRFLSVSLTVLVVVRTQRPGIAEFLKINFKMLGNKLFIEFGTQTGLLKLNYKREL